MGVKAFEPLGLVCMIVDLFGFCDLNTLTFWGLNQDLDELLMDRSLSCLRMMLIHGDDDLLMRIQ